MPTVSSTASVSATTNMTQSHPQSHSNNDNKRFKSATESRMSESPTASSSKTLQLLIRDQTGHEMCIKLTRSTLLEKAFAAYARNRGLPRSSLRFHCDGKLTFPLDTANTLELEDNEQIDVLFQQLGD